MLGEYLSLYTKYGEQVIFIPFICKRCGKCCRVCSVFPYNGKQIAKYMKISLKQLVSKLEEHIKKHPLNKPCFFFNQDKNECSIYPVRPEPCIDFPINTDFGDGGIDCPGKKESIMLYKGFLRGYNCYCIQQDKKISINPEFWNKVLKKLNDIRVSDELKKEFIRINETEVKK